MTLLGACWGTSAPTHYIIDATSGCRCLQGFENMGGFERLLRWRPNTKLAVMVFGLFHGFGLPPRSRSDGFCQRPGVANIVSFNVGVEIGQGLALTAVLIAITALAQESSFLRHSFAANTAMMMGGFVLWGYQDAGYMQ